ncbi:putative secreted protein (Por secretion system target) [Flavobacterium sp. 1]|uniref:T9SS type A sorting domain-containing protein n=1 Tax=Flavobacterium sp. 1 TaxID=2035200 RepID=UPI000C23021E|nr:T9SS type A sorting domain-containing protein [Flavobacterium sp. 1]PJJ08129.1 putative secreted protein (Por secretion system target) [Flavobacterium sp. 1]
MNKKIIFIIFLLVSTVSSFAQFTFKNIPIGGGGFVTGVISHKTTGDIYCRTDVGGAYRWDAVSNKWVQLLNWIPDGQGGYMGVEALAIDEQNPNNIYMLCGTSYINNGATAILKSTDKGNSFTVVDVTSKFKAHGNGYGRGNGERLVVDPHNSSVLFCGTRANGLWKSIDGGVTWNLAWNGVTSTPNENGICFVLFDPSTASGGTTKTMYIGVSRKGAGNANFYKSTDGGVTFTPISPTTDFMPHRAVLQGTTMYVTYADSEGPGTNNAGRVFKLNTSTGVWTNVTPLTWGNTSLSYGGVDIDPANVNRVVISTTGVYNNNQYGTAWGDFIYFSTDGGSTWTIKNGSNSTFNNNGIGYTAGQVNWAECAVFDPFDSNKVRVVGGGGIFTCPNITATNPVWKLDVIGIEETAFLDGISIPGGPFVCAMGDMDGFLLNDITTFPQQLLQPNVGTNRSVVFAAGNTNKLARSSDGGKQVYYSADMGATWTGCTTTKGPGGRLALSADGGTIINCPNDANFSQQQKVYYSTDNGTNWTESTGVAVWGAIPVADPMNSNYFYIYNPSDGKMYVSSNKGVSFSALGNPGYTSVPWSTTLIRPVLGYEGHVWVPLANNGLKYSIDHGQTYTTISNVTYCRSIGIGKAAPNAAYPTLFIWGTVGGVKGLFRSTDKGVNWIRINDDAHQYGGIEMIVGDNNVFGRAYLAVQGITYTEDLSTLGIENNTVLSNNQIVLYPNPSSKTINLTVEKPNEIVRISVFDMLGRSVETIEQSDIKSEMALGTALTPNIYIVKVFGTNFTKSFKIIKK